MTQIPHVPPVIATGSATSTPRAHHSSRACQQCKQSKVRCLPGGSPATCQRCECRKQACCFDAGPDRRTIRKDTLEHAASLEAQIAKLQARLGEASCRDDNLPSRAGKALSSETRSDRYLDATGYHIADSNGELRWHNASNAFGLGPIALDSAAGPPSLDFLPFPLEPALHAEILDAAFKWHFNAFRLVEHLPFLLALESGSRTCTYSPFLHLAVLAVGCRYVDPAPLLCSDPLDSATRGEPFAQAALALLAEEIALPKFSTVRGLMSLAIYFAGVAKPHQGWIYAGLAYRISEDFGLHVDLPSGSDETLRARRQLLFWTCFTDDLNWSLCIRRKPYHDLGVIQQEPLPLAREDAFAMSGSAWSHETRLQTIAWRIVHAPQPDGNGDDLQGEDDNAACQLWNDLQTWRKAVPLNLRYTAGAELTSDAFELELLYHLLVIHLLKPHFASSRANLRKLSQGQRTASAAAVSDLVLAYQARPGLRFASGNIYHAIFHGGAMAAQLASHATSDHNFRTNLDRVNTCIGALHEHAHTWPSAALVASALAGVRDAVLASAKPVHYPPDNVRGQTDGPSLYSLGEAVQALPPWDNVNYARSHGLETYLESGWHVNGIEDREAMLPHFGSS